MKNNITDALLMFPDLYTRINVHLN